MSADEDRVIGAITRVILDYLTMHPDAADSAEGIQRWWVLPQLGEEPLALVEVALRRLARAGKARRVVLEDGRVVYGAVRGRE